MKGYWLQGEAVMHLVLGVVGILTTQCYLHAEERTTSSWHRHVIDDSLRGADGVRLADINQDGLLDIATGWEESGRTCVYLHPGFAEVKQRWPAVTVGVTPSVEDAVFCDLDGDGAIDVVSSCEGSTKQMFVHWSPSIGHDLLREDGWNSQAFPCAKKVAAWMYALPLQIDNRNGPDLVVAAKGSNGIVGWLQAPADARDIAKWKLHQLYRAGWIMSVVDADVDSDGDLDLVISDRKGKTSGVLWLENPGASHATGDWNEHRIGATGREVMFLDIADMDGDNDKDIVVAITQNEIRWFEATESVKEEWPSHTIRPTFAEGLGRAKAVAVGDITGDERPEIVYSCGLANPPKRGMVWLKREAGVADTNWITQDISGPVGIKFDRIELLDLDGDGDLDALTCEERHQGRGLGVIWYENPIR